MIRVGAVVLLLVVSIGIVSQTAKAHPTQTPFNVSLKVDKVMQLNRWAPVTVRIVSTKDATRTRLELIFPDGTITSERAGQSSWA